MTTPPRPTILHFVHCPAPRTSERLRWSSLKRTTTSGTPPTPTPNIEQPQLGATPRANAPKSNRVAESNDRPAADG
eukprot:scaffold5696_cov119-Isochrysis_galbana.AAC.2